MRTALQVALAFGGGLSVTELLASTRLMRLAVEVLTERREAREDAQQEGQWQADAARRLAKFT